MTDTLSPEIIERICRLNACLTEAANWIARRAKLTRDAYFAGGGKENFQQGEYGKDYELEVIVKCSLGNDDPAFMPDDEYANIIAVASHRLTNFTQNGDFLWNECCPHWGEGLPDTDTFRKTQFCHLFHEVYDHILGCNLDALIRIGEIEINLVLLRQRGVSLDTALLPIKLETPYPRSVFSQTHCRPSRDPLTDRELRYARLLNQKMEEGRAWVDEQARRSEKEYKDVGGLDCHITEDGAYEDYELMLCVQGFLDEIHPEHNDENDGTPVVTHSEAIRKKSQQIFGRSRNPFHYDRYGTYFSKDRCRSWDDDLCKVRPCGLFWDIFRKADDDWLKMLSIGHIWFDVAYVQRRIVTDVFS